MNTKIRLTGRYEPENMQIITALGNNLNIAQEKEVVFTMGSEVEMSYDSLLDASRVHGKKQPKVKHHFTQELGM